MVRYSLLSLCFCYHRFNTALPSSPPSPDFPPSSSSLTITSITRSSTDVLPFDHYHQIFHRLAIFIDTNHHCCYTATIARSSTASTTTAIINNHYDQQLHQPPSRSLPPPSSTLVHHSCYTSTVPPPLHHYLCQFILIKISFSTN